MFAIVRTGGKQYRVAPGDKIVVEKLAGEAGDSIDLTDVLLAGDGADLKSTTGLVVAAEIVAQAKADKVTVFKKRRRHNYRRKAGHRQQLTILKIVSIGGERKKTAAPKTEKAGVASQVEAPSKAAKPASEKAPTVAKAAKPASEKAPTVAKVAKPAAEKASAKAPGSKAASTKDAAPAKAATKKAAPKAAAKTEKK